MLTFSFGAAPAVSHIVALSGGADSTALALRLAEIEPRDYTYLITPTGDELPEMLAHWAKLEGLLGKPLTRVTNGTLNSLISEFGALPNFRQRWCTRILKIQPAIAFVKRAGNAIMYVGLRADEETREGIYDDAVKSRFPLREWGWDRAAVLSYLAARDVAIPQRTDCARCYHQRLVEWKRLAKNHPAIYQDAVDQEKATGHTFRSPGRDTWPVPLDELREAFASGRKVRGEDEDESETCRVCTL
jgi:3'-phosphoadenosine 5'-phosphosulfate sulfotransferase (PAPS reductase)/FAD synthetase